MSTRLCRLDVGPHPGGIYWTGPAEGVEDAFARALKEQDPPFLSMIGLVYWEGEDEPYFFCVLTLLKATGQRIVPGTEEELERRLESGEI